MTPLETLKQLRKTYQTPMSADQLGELLNAVAWAHREEGYGVLSKPNGANCRQPRTGTLISRDILMLKGTGRIFDCLIDAEGRAEPTWGEKKSLDPSRWVMPVLPGSAPLPPPQKPEPPPPTVIPYNESYAVEFGHACNDVYRETPAAKDAGMIAVFATRAAYDHYVGGLAWPAALGKHLAAFRAEYGL